MREKTIKLYTYSELSDEAKAKARGWYRDVTVGDEHYRESVYALAADAALLFGFSIRQRRVALMNGTHKYRPAIYYRGFWSQGDGACCEGNWRAADVKPGDVAECHPQDAELQRIAAEFERIARAYPDACFSVAHHGRHYHSGETMFDVDMNPAEDSDDVTRTTKAWNAIRVRDGAVAGELIRAARDFMDWIYKQLETEYEYQNSDAVVAETIEANEYEFTADGERAD